MSDTAGALGDDGDSVIAATVSLLVNIGRYMLSG
jgi:hypothetical protein